MISEEKAIKKFKRLLWAIKMCSDNDLIILTAYSIMESNKRNLTNLVNDIIDNVNMKSVK